MWVEALIAAGCMEDARLRPASKAQGHALAAGLGGLGKRLGVPALTADRAWAKADIEEVVQLVR